MNPRHLKVSLLSVLALLAALLASSCASSERMNRIGWDSDAYSAPKSSRISGGKYDDAVASLRTPVGLQDRQVNVWPFCTVNSRYVSILWPFIDWDDFGMAIRPFYNREGNDASILFPLSSWNPVDGDGWALNAYWDPDYYGMFPLFHVGRQPDAFWFAGPFVGDGDSFGVLPLCYFGDDLNFVGPVWWDAEPPEIKETSRDFGFFPLFWKYEGGSALLPLYAMNETSFYSLLLYMSRTTDDEGNKLWGEGRYLVLGYWDDDCKSHGFFPFYDIDAGDEERNHVLLWWWRRNSPDCGLFPFAWFHENGGSIFPFTSWKKRSATGMNGEEEKWTEGNVLLLGYWDRHAYGVFPFFRGSSAVDDMKYLGPLWWAYDEDEREYGFFPFFRVERSQGETKKSYCYLLPLLPIYDWEKDRYGSEFTSIPFARKDYVYPEFRTTASEYERRYLIYDTYRKTTRKFNGENDRDDFIPYWGYSESFRADKKKLMAEEDLTQEEAEHELDSQVLATSEERSTAILPFAEWSNSDDGDHELSFLFYLLNFERTKTSYSDNLLWGLLLSAAREEEKDMFGLPKSSGHFNILGLFPGSSTKSEFDSQPVLDSGFYSFAMECVDHYLYRSSIPDGSEESDVWAKELLNELTEKHYIQNFSPAKAQPGQAVPPLKKIDTEFFHLSNEDVFRICGIDRAISGEITAEEAGTLVKHLIDAVISKIKDGGEQKKTAYGFLPLFLRLRETLEKNGGEETVSSKLITLLFDTEINQNGQDKFELDVLLGLLGHYTDKKTGLRQNGMGDTEKSFSVLTLIRSGRDTRPEFDIYPRSLEDFAKALKEGGQTSDNPVVAAYSRAIVTAECDSILKSFRDDSFAPGFKAAVTAYRDGARTDSDTRVMLETIAQCEDYLFAGDRVATYGGFYPFFFWNKSCLEKDGGISNVSKSWFVLPLLSGGSSSDEGSSLGILTPLLYFGSTKVHDGDVPHPGRIIPASANALQASHSIDPVKGEAGRYALFLVGTTDETFVQWKPETEELVSSLYGSLYELKENYEINHWSPAFLEKTAADKPKETSYGHSYADWNNLAKQINRALAQIGMKPLDRGAEFRDSIPPVLKEIADKYIVTRTVSGFNTGWGLTSSSFECKETGDYQTKVLFGLGANSQKIGEKEHRSILGYLYNMDTDGVNTRKFIFPFITTKDAPGFHEWSFLGGLFERSEEDGKTGGRIFFFPYGNRPGNKD